MRRSLRVFHGPSVGVKAPTVAISFGEFRRIVLDAEAVQRSWMQDFDGDQMQVPEDLLEVLTAYRQLMPSA